MFSLEFDFEFRNESSFTVTVTPNNQEGWSEFVLAPSETRTVTLPETRVKFVHDWANTVTAGSSVDGIITFRDI